MRPSACIAVLLGVQSCLCAASDYQQRRENLRKALKNGVTVLFGRSARDSSDLRSGFFQEPNFYYLTGWMEPGAILLLAPNEPREILFVPRRDPDEEVWTGRKRGPDDAGYPRGHRLRQSSCPPRASNRNSASCWSNIPKLYALTDRPEAAKLKRLAPLRDIFNATLAIAKLRMEKSPEELALHAARCGCHASPRIAPPGSAPRRGSTNIRSRPPWRRSTSTRAASATPMRPSSARGRTPPCCTTRATRAAWIAASCC